MKHIYIFCYINALLSFVYCNMMGHTYHTYVHIKYSIGSND